MSITIDDIFFYLIIISFYLGRKIFSKTFQVSGFLWRTMNDEYLISLYWVWQLIPRKIFLELFNAICQKMLASSLNIYHFVIFALISYWMSDKHRQTMIVLSLIVIVSLTVLDTDPLSLISTDLNTNSTTSSFSMFDTAGLIESHWIAVVVVLSLVQAEAEWTMDVHFRDLD